MQIAYVIGSAITTIKDEKFRGHKLLMVQAADEKGRPGGPVYIAVDTVDAGAGDLVVVTQGSSARQTAYSNDAPIDAVIVAIIDSLEVSGTVTFRKQ
jgi:microcompartment protein CcmK/EutM